MAGFGNLFGKNTTASMPVKNKTAERVNNALNSLAQNVVNFPRKVIDLANVVTIDFETYWSVDFTLRKQNTSTYIRDTRFKAHMVGLKIGEGPVRVIPNKNIKRELAKIDWKKTYLLCHNTAFDGFILSHHYSIVPMYYLDTLSMARGLHSNDISASLDSVAGFYGVGNKLPDVLIQSKGLVTLPPSIYAPMAEYCAEDVRLTFEIFQCMLMQYPAEEIDLIDLTIRMACDPVFLVDIPRVEKELEREMARKERLLLQTIGDEKEQAAAIAEHGKELVLEVARKRVNSNKTFAEMLEALHVEPPTKISPTTGNTVYAFAKNDLDFSALLDHPNESVRDLVDCRLAVKSTIGETRAIRFIEAGRNGWALPVFLNYYGAHTGRWSGGNKMNMQNLVRKGELRKSIIAKKGYQVVVRDSGQIECRVLAELAGQDDLIADIRLYDQGLDRDPYCKFADTIYVREITKADGTERFVGKVAVLGLGYGMGGKKFCYTLASGAMGMKVELDEQLCAKIVQSYRRKNSKITLFWSKCESILADMATGRTGSYKCLHWEKERIWLPNGMCLKYPGLRAEFDADGRQTGWTYQRKKERVHIYGGLLCENIVQALARIIIADQMLDISKRWRVGTTTHDEIVAVVPTRQAKKCYDDMGRVMMKPPSFMPTLPLASEGGWDVNYSK